MSHPQWKNCKLVSCLEVIGENCAYVIYCSVDFFFKSIGNTHTKFHHKRQKIMTKLLIPKSEWVWKNLGWWCCGSCQALLKLVASQTCMWHKFQNPLVRLAVSKIIVTIMGVWNNDVKSKLLASGKALVKMILDITEDHWR